MTTANSRAPPRREKVYLDAHRKTNIHKLLARLLFGYKPDIYLLMDPFLFPSRQADDPPRDPETLEMFPADTEALSLAQFKREGAFLHQAELASAALERRLSLMPAGAVVLTLSRDELQRLAQQFGQVVAIAKEYHLDAADTAA